MLGITLVARGLAVLIIRGRIEVNWEPGGQHKGGPVQRPQQSPMPLWFLLEVYDTIGIPGIFDHGIGNYSGPYSKAWVLWFRLLLCGLRVYNLRDGGWIK